MTTGPQAAAGWYRIDARTERWWDGTAWGPQTRQVWAPQVPTRAVTYRPRKTNHVLHLILTLLTGGLWGLFVWLPITFLHKLSRERVVTRYR